MSRSRANLAAPRLSNSKAVRSSLAQLRDVRHYEVPGKALVAAAINVSQEGLRPCVPISGGPSIPADVGQTFLTARTHAPIKLESPPQLDMCSQDDAPTR